MINSILIAAKGFLQHFLTLFLALSIVLTPAGVNKTFAFSVGDEKEIGEKLLSVVRKSFKLLDEPDINQYINQLGAEILAVTGTQFFKYHFFVINDGEFNAFAAPSGLIFVHSGLIEAMETEGELLSVMAHECGHVTSRHIADRIKKTSKTSIATAALLIAGIAIGGGALSEALITGSMAAGASLNLKFSRQDEEEADRLAFKWMEALGTNPSPMSSMLNKMHKISVYRMAQIPPYLLTHPEPKRRLGYVQDLMFMNEATKDLPQRDNFNFLRIKQRILSYTKKTANLRLIANRQLEKAGDNIQKIAMAHYGLHLAYLNEADWGMAEKEIQQVISAYPNQTILITDLGNIFFQKGEFNKALHFFQKAKDKDPDCNYTLYNLARTWQQLQKNEKALRIYSELLASSPDYARLHYQIGQIKAGQNEKGASHYHLGYYYWLEGNPKMAKFHLEQVLNSENTPGGIKEKAKNFKKKISKLEKS